MKMNGSIGVKFSAIQSVVTATFKFRWEDVQYMYMYKHTTDTSACTGLPYAVHVLLLWEIDQV